MFREKDLFCSWGKIVRVTATHLDLHTYGMLRNKDCSWLTTFRNSLWVQSLRVEQSKFFKDCLITRVLGQLVGPIFKGRAVKILWRLLGYPRFGTACGSHLQGSSSQNSLKTAWLPTFWDSLWVLSSRVKQSKFFEDCLFVYRLLEQSISLMKLDWLTVEDGTDTLSWNVDKHLLT
jgi:hypothetical protein